MTKRSSSSAPMPSAYPLAKRSRYVSSERASSRTPRTTSKFKQRRTQWPYASQKSYKFYHDPFPALMRCRLRYSTNLSLNATSGVIAYNLFRCNSIFDPDYTGVGHQPYGHDTYQQIYNHYRVESAVISVSHCTGVNGVLGISLTDDTTVETDYDTVKERKGTVMLPTVSGNGNTRHNHIIT